MDSKSVFLIAILVCSTSRTVASKIKTNKEMLAGSTMYDINDYRLNPDFVPKSYELKLEIASNFVESRIFEGTVKIEFSPTKVMRYTHIKLNVENITLHKTEEVKLYKSGTSINLLNNEENPVPHDKYQTLTLRLKDNVKLSNECIYIIRIKYTASFQFGTNGFYLNNYVDENKKLRWVAATNLFPTHARKVFPCFDEPGFKARFSISIAYPSEYRVISNTKAKNIRKNTNGITTTVFMETPCISTHSVAIILSNFDSWTYLDSEVGDNAIWSLRKSILLTNYGYNITPKIIQLLNAITTIPYSNFSLKLDQVVLPNLEIESIGNWALIAYKDSAFLLDDIESTTSNKQKILTTIAKELSYIWFGNLVSIHWWSDAWLSQGLACYFSFFASSMMENTWGLEEYFVAENHQQALANDVEPDIEPLSSKNGKIYTKEHIDDKINFLSSSKGAAVIRMMDSFIGKKQLINGVRTYIKRNATGNAVPGDLWQALTEAVGNNHSLPTSLNDIMTTWTNQVGFPVVNVNIAENNVVLTQRAYQIRNNATNNILPRWFIPISYTTSHEKQFHNTSARVWMNPKTLNVTAGKLPQNTKWIIVNLQNTAYIRINYHPRLWRALITALMTPEFDNIHVLNRAQIVDDAFHLGRAGIISYNLTLDVASYLKMETDYYPWNVAFKNFNYLRIRMHHFPKAQGLLNTYIFQTMNKFYKNSLYPNATNFHVNKLKKSLAFEWACKLGSSSCIQIASSIYNLNTRLNIRIDPDLKTTVFCTVLSNTNVTSHWITLRGRLARSSGITETLTIIKALGCTSNEELLNLYLSETISLVSNIAQQNRKDVLEAVITGSSKGAELAFNFIKSNLNKIIIFYGGVQKLTNSLILLSNQLNDQNRIHEFVLFLYKNNKYLMSIESTINRILSNCENNLHWIDNYGRTIVDYLQRKLNPVPVPPSTTDSTTLLTTPENQKNNTASYFLPILTLTILNFIPIVLIR